MSAAAPAAAAVPQCTGTVSKSVLYSDLGRLESVIAGGAGRLYVSLDPPDASPSRLISITRPGAAPFTVADGPDGPGGLAWDRRNLLWGYGNSLENGETGDANPTSGLYRVNLARGPGQSYRTVSAWRTESPGPPTARSSRRTTSA